MGIQRKQHRHAGNQRARQQVLGAHGGVPGGLQLTAAHTFGGARHFVRGDMMEGVTKGLLAKYLVAARVQNKGVPQRIGQLAGHVQALFRIVPVQHKKLAQSVFRQKHFSLAKPGIVGLQG